jgi:hypothetical protein
MLLYVKQFDQATLAGEGVRKALSNRLGSSSQLLSDTDAGCVIIDNKLFCCCICRGIMIEKANYSHVSFTYF